MRLTFIRLKTNFRPRHFVTCTHSSVWLVFRFCSRFGRPIRGANLKLFIVCFVFCSSTPHVHKMRDYIIEYGGQNAMHLSNVSKFFSLSIRSLVCSFVFKWQNGFCTNMKIVIVRVDDARRSVSVLFLSICADAAAQIHTHTHTQMDTYTYPKQN